MRDTGAIEVVSRSEIGLRRKENQDCCGTWLDADGRCLLAVCDGMGGHRGGALASSMAIDAIGRHFEAARGRDASALLREAFEQANRSIHEAGARDRELEGMGTTGVALLADAAPQYADAWVAHVGDSRAYRLRDGALELLTRDHSVRALLASQVLAADAAELPQSHALLRAIGSEPEVEVEIRPVSMQPGDRFLLCSDGLWDLVDAEPIRSVLLRYPPAEAARILVEEANRRGGRDNITVQIAALPPAPAGPRSAGARARLARAAVPIAAAAIAAATLLLLGLLLVLGT